MGDKWCFIEYSTVGTRLGRVFFFLHKGLEMDFCGACMCQCMYVCNKIAEQRSDSGVMHLGLVLYCVRWGSPEWHRSGILSRAHTCIFTDVFH